MKNKKSWEEKRKRNEEKKGIKETFPEGGEVVNSHALQNEALKLSLWLTKHQVMKMY
jgi:hypothetical protein